jgi:hypothetical protein
MAEMLCQNCGSFGGVRTHVKGSFWIEVVLWSCFVVPGVIYSMWRWITTERACPICGAPNMIPLESPRGWAASAAQARSAS